MQEIIPPVDIRLIKNELTPEKKLCDTNKAGNEIYIFDAYSAPNTLREVGRLREITFRAAGGSSGLSCDLDHYDTMEKPCKQMVVWDPEEERILGGYRFIEGKDIVLKEDGQPDIATSHLFRFSDEFIRHYLPHVLELGRSFVVPEYQSSAAGAKGIFILDNLWDGITGVVMRNPEIFYFFGKMTMYPDYDPAARDLILYFLNKHFPDPDRLAVAYNPVLTTSSPDILGLILDEDEIRPDYRKLKAAVRRLGTTIPPLVNSYINISPTMRMCGMAVNDEFGDCLESGILVCFDEIFPDSRDRHVAGILSTTMQRLAERFPLVTLPTREELLQRWNERRTKRLLRFKKRMTKE